MTFFMDKLIVVTFFLLFVIIVKLILVNKSRDKLHSLKMIHLKKMMKTLIQKQKILQQKTNIIATYQIQHKTDMKKLSDEIFELQKRIFESLSNK